MLLVPSSHSRRPSLPADYKQGGGQYDDFGNFNYAAAGVKAGFPEWILAMAAGAAQVRAGMSKGAWIAPFGLGSLSVPGTLPMTAFPFGDSPKDQLQIYQGFQYAENGCQ